MATQLNVLARAGILVLDLEYARATGRRRYIGRLAVPARTEADIPAGEPRHLAANHFLPPDETPLSHWSYPKSGMPETVPADVHDPEYIIRLAHYAKAIKERELWPADAETAAYCGVEFDPTFGGEAVAKE